MNSLTNLSELWTMVSRGDHDAFALLHKNLYPGLYHYILRIVEDEDTSDDILQDLFIKVWNKRMQIGEIKNVKAYYFTAARSMAINHLRQNKYKHSKMENFCFEESTFSCEDILITDERNGELKVRMVNVLNKLSARQKEIIYLKFYEGFEYQKIAIMTGIRYQSVVNHVFRALEILRAELTKKQCEAIFA